MKPNSGYPETGFQGQCATQWIRTGRFKPTPLGKRRAVRSPGRGAHARSLRQRLGRDGRHGVPRVHGGDTRSRRQPETARIRGRRSRERVGWGAAPAPMEGRRVWLPESADWLEDFLLGILALPNGRFDDQVDSVSYLLN